MAPSAQKELGRTLFTSVLSFHMVKRSQFFWFFFWESAELLFLSWSIFWWKMTLRANMTFKGWKIMRIGVIPFGDVSLAESQCILAH